MRSATRRSRHGAGANASVLIVVLWASIGLVSITLLFGHSMLMTYRGVDNELAGHQAEQAIDGVQAYVSTLLSESTTPGILPQPSSYFSESVPVGEATIWLLGRPADSTSLVSAQSFGLVDEASKLNLNTATATMLQGLPGMTEELATAIVDWVLTTNGTTATAYAQKRPPYQSKNAKFESIEELALVQGATRQILYGEDGNLNGVVDANEDDGEKSQPSDNADGKLDSGILEYVTVFSLESNKRSDGSARIDVRQPSASGPLRTLLSANLGADRATQILRTLGPGSVGSVLEFFVASGMSEEEFAKIYEAISTTAGTEIPGLINVNTASAVVLGCVPGITPAIAAQLISARQTRVQQDANIAWVVPILGVENVKLAGKYLTGRCSQVSADVAAVGRYGRGYRRTKFVIDTSTGTAQVIYRRNLAPLGWALGSEVRQNFAVQKESP